MTEHRSVQEQSTQPSPQRAPSPLRLAKLFPGMQAALLLLAAILLAGMIACESGANAAPDIAIELYQGQGELGGDSINFSDLRGRPVVLNFWAGLCPPCRAEIPHFQEFAEEFEGRALVLGLDVGQFTQLGNQDDARTLLQDLAVTYPAGFTLDGTVMRNYEVLTMPTTVFVTADGAVFRKWSGVLDLEKLTEITNNMLAQ